MAKQILNDPVNPDALGILINSLSRVAAKSAGLSALEQKLAARLNTASKMDAANRMVRAFRKIPYERRLKAFGVFANPANAFVPDQQGKAAFAKIKASAKDDVGPVQLPPVGPLDRYTLSYTGLYCNAETDLDLGFSNSDEAYVITSVVEVANGVNTVRTEKHPFDQVEYDGIDTGDWRTGPVAACWHGAPNEISLVCSVFERDYGDPNYYREEIDDWVTIAVEAATWYLPDEFGISDKLKELIVDGLNWLLDTDDDLIETQYRVVSRDALRLYGIIAPRALEEQRTRLVFTGPWQPAKVVVVTDTTDIEHHFRTVHKGGGATYMSAFRVSLNKPVPIPVVPVLN